MKLSVAVALASAFAGMSNAADIASPDTQRDDFARIGLPEANEPPSRPWGPMYPNSIGNVGRSLGEEKGNDAKGEDGLAERDVDDLEFDERDYNATETDLGSRDLEARGPWTVYCSPNPKWEDTGLMEARRRAKSVYPDGKGRPYLAAGPGKCSRIACAYDSAIVMCNDNETPLSLPSWKNVIDGANEIFVKCYHDVHGKGLQVRGHAFHKDNWNVIVRKDNC
ncbi:uncharacterized protein BDV17DRAFT_288367 [Aspergillus undulatus]|uniref:uncharacterized protein n=1 Tax=Aspergillus undulatus TaxID=1810928 RepID=UPI003CCD44D7